VGRRAPSRARPSCRVAGAPAIFNPGDMICFAHGSVDCRIEAWPHVKDIFQSICAKEAKSGAPCCDWVGDGGSGHYTKMVHNGIEYGDMQLCAEAYFLLKHIGRYDNQKIHECFTKCASRLNIICIIRLVVHAFVRWKTGDLDSFLIEITADILACDFLK